MDKKECLEMIRCGTCVYMFNSIVNICKKLEMGITDPDNFGCIHHVSEGEYIGSCATCIWAVENYNDTITCTKRDYPKIMDYEDKSNIFKIKDCYAYSKDKFKHYPYPNRVPDTNKVKIEIDLPVLTLIGGLMLTNFKEEITIDNNLGYSVYFTDFYKEYEYRTSTYENYKKDFGYSILDHLLNIEEELNIELDFDVWVKGLMEYVKDNQYSIIDLLNKFCSPTYLLLYLTKRWIKEKGVENAR